MSDFLKFFDEEAHAYPMYLDIYYSKCTDWIIAVYKKGCAEDGTDLKIVYVNDIDMELCFAKAHVQLKEWLVEHEGGY